MINTSNNQDGSTESEGEAVGPNNSVMENGILPHNFLLRQSGDAPSFIHNSFTGGRTSSNCVDEEPKFQPMQPFEFRSHVQHLVESSLASSNMVNSPKERTSSSSSAPLSSSPSIEKEARGGDHVIAGNVKQVEMSQAAFGHFNRALKDANCAAAGNTSIASGEGSHSANSETEVNRYTVEVGGCAGGEVSTGRGETVKNISGIENSVQRLCAAYGDLFRQHEASELQLTKQRLEFTYLRSELRRLQKEQQRDVQEPVDQLTELFSTFIDELQNTKYDEDFT